MIICLNNKCNLNRREFKDYQMKLAKIETRDNLIVCPSLINIPNYFLGNIRLGAQNVSAFENGAHTGEVSADMLKSYQVRYCIVGHSERREFQKETLEEVKLKINQLINNHIVPILCVGETKEEKDKNQTLKRVEEELDSALKDIDSKNIIIAYEPIWSIGSGSIPTNSEIEEVIDFIKKKYPEAKVLYGGSVDETNIDELKKINVIDGFLIGGLSLKPEKLKILLDKIAEK